MLTKDLTPTKKPINISDLVTISNRARMTLMEVRDRMLEPWPRKTPPIINTSRITQLCGIDRARLNYLTQKGSIPAPTLTASKRREYSLANAQEIVRTLRPELRRPEGAPGITICIGNFKGGVGKTTLAVSLAQGLSLKGHKVCVIDLDPQASTTTLFGFVPDAEIEEDATVMPVVYGDKTSLDYAPVETYWPSIDLIPSAPYLFGADYFLPSKQVENPGFEFWMVLDDAMAPLRERYDVIIIDTPPTLSYLAAAAFMAADGMIVPIPPETLDYASSTMFWGQFSELFSSLGPEKKLSKNFDFIKIILSKVKHKPFSTDSVRSLIHQTYPELVGRSELPASDVISNASLEFRTIYDLSKYAGSGKALAAFDAMCDEIDAEIQTAWQDFRG